MQISILYQDPTTSRRSMGVDIEVYLPKTKTVEYFRTLTKALQFVRKYRVTKDVIDSETKIKSLIMRQDCNVFFFEDENDVRIKAFDSEDVKEYARKFLAFTYRYLSGDKYKLCVFMKKGLDISFKKKIFLHELGHIYLGHLTDHGMSDEQQETYAELFAAMIAVLAHTPRICEARGNRYE